jgi:AbrB family looped-hinge helix DNA binding protein
MNHVTRVEMSGRVLIPAKLRKAVGLRAGDSVIIRLTEEGLVITTPERAIQAAQALVRQHVPRERRLSEELIEERRREVEKE